MLWNDLKTIPIPKFKYSSSLDTVFMSFESISLQLSTCQSAFQICHSLSRRKLQTSAVKTCIFWYLPIEHTLYHDTSTSRSCKDKINKWVVISSDTKMKFRAQINQLQELQDAFAWRGLGKLGLVKSKQKWPKGNLPRRLFKDLLN